jgi:Zn-dependent protease/CBS domain-containing protein
MGRPFGIPIYVAPTWFLVAALITYFFAPRVQDELPGIGLWRFGVAFAFAVLLYVSVLVHELSHSVVAVRLGLPVRRISLHFLGGVSEIEKEPRTPGHEFVVAFAGPLLSLLLAGIGYLLWRATAGSPVINVLIGALTWANLLVAIFNLLPGLPLDGGRMLRAVVWKISGRPMTGTLVAAWVGRGLAIAIVLLSVVSSYTAPSAGGSGFVSVLWGVLIGSFVWMGATQAMRVAQVRERLPSLLARRLARRAIPVTADLPLAEALRRAEQVGARGLVVVDHGGRPTALVNEAAVAATPTARRPWVQVGTLAKTLSAGMVLSAELGGESLLDALRAEPTSEYLVVEPTGEVFGVLAAADVQRAFAGQ